MSRVANGWVDTAVQEPVPSVMDDMDEVEGVSEQELEDTLRRGTEARPLGLQQTVNAEAARWAKEWQADCPQLLQEGYEVVQGLRRLAAADAERAAATLTAERLWELRKRFKRRTGTGQDCVALFDIFWGSPQSRGTRPCRRGRSSRPRRRSTA